MFDEAKEISQNTKPDEKFSFALQYDTNQKEFLLSMLGTVGAIVEDVDENSHILSTMMNMTQLAFIKHLNCVERVKTDEGINPFLAEEAVKLTPIQQNHQEDESLDNEVQEVITNIDDEMPEIQTEPATYSMTDANLEVKEIVEENKKNDGIAVASVAASARSSCSSCCCPTNLSMETAATISDESYTSGYICCPGSEQWFKFVATRTGRYTICTTGSLDTIGSLYDCCGNLITEVDDYAPCGKINFRIIRNLTAGNTYYVKVRIYGNDTGSYTLRVTERVFANYVTINKSTITLEKDVLYELPITPNYTYKGYNGAQRIPGLSVSINPSNANEQKIWWWEQYGDVLECSYGWDDDGDRYIHVTATGIGTAKLYAQDWKENGKRDECTVYVGGAPVTGISLDRSTKTVSLNDTEQLTAIITPTNALNKGVTWNSSNWSVVDVDNNGVITGLRVGTATISATTDEGGYRATCVVSVDRREKVTVKKDSHSFHVRFADGKVWKNIGIDLSNRQENYNQLYPPNMWYENYEYLIEEEQRYLDNIYVEENGVLEYQTYSVKQIAYLYLLDPLGIEYYMRNHACHDKDIMSGEFLTFKNEVYEAIFGNSERLSGRFYFTVADGQPQYGRYSGCNRMDVYSNAEVLFGFHTVINWDLGEFIKSVLQGLFEWAMEDSIVGKGIQTYQILFHAGGILGACSDQVSSYVTNYINEGIEGDIKEKFGEKVLKTCHWALTLTYILADSALSAFSLPNPQDITIYNKIHAEPDFLTTIDGFDGEWSIKDIIDQVNQN